MQEVAVDAQLAERARAGDVNAFNKLVSGRTLRMGRLAMAITGNEADAREAVQEAWIAIWRNLPNLREPRLFEAWAGRILIRACLLTLKRTRHRGAHEGYPATFDGPDTPTSAGPEELLVRRSAIERAFDSLDADRRALLVLHHFAGLRLGEISAQLDIPVGTVKSRLFLARRALERALEDQR